MMPRKIVFRLDKNNELEGRVTREDAVYIFEALSKMLNKGKFEEMTSSDFESVDQPEHYALSSMECIDAMVAVFGLKDTQKYTEIAAFKYLWRMDRKHKTSVGDKLKAIWYLRFSMGDDPREAENATINEEVYKDPYDMSGPIERKR